MLIRYLNPHEKRMKDVARRIPIGVDPIRLAAAKRHAEMDLGIRSKMRALQERIPLLLFCRAKGGSGFRMSRILRYFFMEYANRIRNGGLEQLPSSFNIVEAFLRFSEEYFIFDLRAEEEHILQGYDFFDWYTSSARRLVDDAGILRDTLSEGTIYAYDILGTPGDFSLSTAESKIALLGISLVRHGDELSVVLLAGENPPYPSHDEVLEISATSIPVRGRETVAPDESLSIESRLVAGLPDYSQVVLLTRIYIDSCRYDVRYINLDIGQQFFVLTDDLIAVSSIDNDRSILDTLTDRLHRYDDLFSALAALIYLPVYFAERQSEVISTRFATGLRADSSSKVKRALRVLDNEVITLYREIKCLPSQAMPRPNVHEVKPPELRLTLEGYWKELAFHEFGEDPDGNPIAGRTWVERRDCWFTHDPNSFLIRREIPADPGADPGEVYVMRSPSHEKDVYKIGLTRRPVSVRAQEIGYSTGVPLPFGILANWSVGDCSAVEANIHKRLSLYRVSKRREFFRAPLSLIIRTIDEVTKII